MKVQSAERIETAESKGKAEAYITQGVRLVIAGLHERSLEVSKCVRSCIWIDKPPIADVALLHLFSFYISRFPYNTSLSFRPKKKNYSEVFPQRVHVYTYTYLILYSHIYIDGCISTYTSVGF